MEIVIRKMDSATLEQVDQSDSTFIVDSRLSLFAEDGRIRYEIVPALPREKHYPPEQSEYSSYLNDPDKAIFFAYIDEELAGQIRVLKYWNAYAYIDDLAVAPGFRQRGVGRALLQRAKEWAVEKDCPGLMLETQDINVPACRLYQSFGFELGGFDRLLYRGLDPATHEIALYWYLVF